MFGAGLASVVHPREMEEGTKRLWFSPSVCECDRGENCFYMENLGVCVASIDRAAGIFFFSMFCLCFLWHSSRTGLLVGVSAPEEGNDFIIGDK